MNAEQHVPPFRFKGFSDFWEQRKLSDLAMFNPRLELPDSFQYVDLESVSGTELINHRTETKSSAPSRAQRLAKKGDIFYQTVRPYQKNNYLYEKSDDDYVFSTGYAQLRPYEDGYFLFSRLQENGFVSTVLDHSTGTSYPAINSNDLAKLEIMVPLNLNEQQAIGKLFRHIDNAIALHQHKLAKLKELKKGYLQKLFPQNGETVPEFRFKGYSDAWEKRKLQELLVERNDPSIESKTYPLMSFTGTDGVTPKGRRYDRSALVKSSSKKYKKTQKNDLIYSSNNLETGSIGLNKTGNAVISPVYSVFQVTDEAIPSFMGNMILRRRFIDKMLRYRQGIMYGQWRIHELDFLQIVVNVPQTAEQFQIGQLFSALDALIAATQCKLDLLKKLKKGYLQKMFC